MPIEAIGRRRRWIERVGNLAVVCAASPSSRQAACWEQVVALLEAAPIALDKLGLSARPSATRDTWVNCDAWESAALGLLGSEAGYVLSRGRNGTCLASVALPGCDGETTSEGSTVALAVMAALLLHLADTCCID